MSSIHVRIPSVCACSMGEAYSPSSTGLACAVGARKPVLAMHKPAALSSSFDASSIGVVGSCDCSIGGDGWMLPRSCLLDGVVATPMVPNDEHDVDPASGCCSFRSVLTDGLDLATGEGSSDESVRGVSVRADGEGVSVRA